MKIRRGFVSNSSSSSFIVAFMKLPTNVREMAELLFGKDVKDSSTYLGDYAAGRGWPVFQVAEDVFKDFQEGQPLSDEKAAEEVSRGYYDGYPQFPNYWEEKDGEQVQVSEEETKVRWKKFNDQVKNGGKKLFKQFMKQFDGGEKPQLYVFSYADETDYGSALEHGDLFKRLPHLRISHH